MKASSGSARAARAARAPARSRAEPLANLHFEVAVERLGQGGAVEVILPTARIVEVPGRGRITEMGPLVISRALTESADWYRWWDETRRAKRIRPRLVTISVLRSAGGGLGVRWFFRDAVPAAYSVSPLNALVGAPLIESLELRVGDFDLYERQ